MDELIGKSRYSRNTSAYGSYKNRARDTEGDIISTIFAAKLLTVVVFLSVFALCKAANTPTTNFFVSKVKEIATINYDVNKYIIPITKAIGIKLPTDIQVSDKINTDDTSDLSKDSLRTVAEEMGKEAPITLDSSTSTENTQIKENNIIKEESSNISNTIKTNADKKELSQVGMLQDSEIKAITDKYSFIVPIKGKISSGFGTRTDPLTGEAEFHRGIDIEANMGTSIKAALGGEVVEVGSAEEYGRYIKIQHKDGIETIYAFCSTLIAKKGQKVNQGDVIAKVGDTEGLSGAYLHFEVCKNDKAVDPEKLFNYLNQ